MPIKPENKKLYPPDWPQIREEILHRAGNRCEKCGIHNHDWGWRDHWGVFHRVNKRTFLDVGYKRPPFVVAVPGGRLRIIEIVLTIAHLDHNPENCDRENLRAWCQRCHLLYDAEHHAQSAAATRRKRLEQAGQMGLYEQRKT